MEQLLEKQLRKITYNNCFWKEKGKKSSTNKTKNPTTFSDRKHTEKKVFCVSTNIFITKCYWNDSEKR